MVALQHQSRLEEKVLAGERVSAAEARALYRLPLRS